MRVPFCLAAAVVLALTASSAWGNGLLYQLPKDGTWANYGFDATIEIGDDQETRKGSIRLASVGKTTEQGKPCRWIEVVFESQVGDRDALDKTTVKALVPEEHLGKGKTPLDHVIRAWIRKGKSDPKELKNPKDINNGPLPVVLAPPLKDAKQLDEKTVASKLGELSCLGVTGTVQFAGDDDRGKFDFTFETRLHSKSPFGVVASRWVMKMGIQGQIAAVVTMNLKLSDFGNNAKSELPEQK